MMRCSVGGGTPTTNFSCTERQCEPYLMPPGYNPGKLVPGVPVCAAGIVLRALSPPRRCTLACGFGYTAVPTLVDDASGADAGTEAHAGGYLSCGLDGGVAQVSGFSCREHRCAAYPFPPGVVGDPSGPDGACASGQSGARLSAVTNRTCSLHCGSGYFPARAQLVCGSDADDGDVATTSIECVPQYALVPSLDTPTPSQPSPRPGYRGTMTCGAVGSTATTTRDPATCGGVRCDSHGDGGWFGHVTYSAAAEAGGEVALGGCQRCYHFADVASVKDASCTSCTSATAADCHDATCAAGYTDYSAGRCSPSVCAAPEATHGRVVIGCVGMHNGDAEGCEVHCAEGFSAVQAGENRMYTGAAGPLCVCERPNTHSSIATPGFMAPPEYQRCTNVPAFLSEVQCVWGAERSTAAYSLSLIRSYALQAQSLALPIPPGALPHPLRSSPRARRTKMCP